MAFDWIKMRCSLPDDPAVVALAARLGCDEFAIVGRLHKLWSWADAHTTDGRIDGVTPAWIDRTLDMPGFAAAMVTVGWLAVEGETLCFPRFERHNGASAKRRAENTDRQRASRSKRDKSATEPSRTVRDTSATREEKRREYTPPPTPPGGREEEGGRLGGIPEPIEPDPWGDAAQRLRQLGVTQADAAIGAARRNGATLTMVHAAIEWYLASKGAWEPGALYGRIAALAPGTDPTAHWPPMAEEFRRREANAEREARDRRQQAERKAKDQARRQQHAAELQLERDWGPKVDALTRDQAEAILRAENSLGAENYIRSWEPGEPVTGAARSLLLLALRDTWATPADKTAVAT